MNSKAVLVPATAAVALGLALGVAPAAFAETPTTAAVATTVTANPTVSQPIVTRDGNYYRLTGTVTGIAAGAQITVVNAQNNPVPGFTPFAYSGNGHYSLRFTPGQLAGNYGVKIGNTISPKVYLNALGQAAMGSAA